MKLCVTTVVDKKYVHYIPLFIYCLRYAYPEYKIKIFTLCDYPSHKFAEIVPNYFEGHRPGFNTIALRFLVPKKEFKNFDYVYITDIDMLIMREGRPLHTFHLQEMASTGLCYSNSTRNSKHWKGEESLSGLHFCAYEWFEKVEKEADRYRDYLLNTPERREFDGHMLYNMCRNSGLGIPGKFKLIPRHHGIHLGNFRLFEKTRDLKKRIPMTFRFQWMRMRNNNNFLNMIRECNDPMVDKLDKFCGL